MASPQNPKAVSHMMWFFVIPSVLFMGWAAWKFAGGVLNPKPSDAFSKLAEVREARTPGDRWQAAYGLAQALQKMKSENALETLPDAQKNELYAGLTQILRVNASDARLRKYLLLTLGQLGDTRGLPALETGIADAAPETRFYSAWSYIEILSKNPEAVNDARIITVKAWLSNEDPALRKLSASFLAQRGARYWPDVEKQFTDPEREVRWNAGVALASMGDKAAIPVLNELFDLTKLRASEIASADDLQRLLASAAGAAVKLGDAELLQKAKTLRSGADATTPEGRAIQAGLRGL